MTSKEFWARLKELEEKKFLLKESTGLKPKIWVLKKLKFLGGEKAGITALPGMYFTVNDKGFIAFHEIVRWKLEKNKYEEKDYTIMDESARVFHAIKEGL